MGKKKDKKKWKDNFDKHLGENSNDKGMALKQLDVISVLCLIQQHSRDRFTVQRMLIYKNVVFLPGHAVSSMQAI